MTGLSKRAKVWQGKIAAETAYPIDQALALVRENASAKFRERHR